MHIPVSKKQCSWALMAAWAKTKKEGVFLNRVLYSGIAATISFAIHGAIWATAFQKAIGGFLAESLVFGGATIAISAILFATTKKCNSITLPYPRLSPVPSRQFLAVPAKAQVHLGQRQPPFTEALASDSRKAGASEVSGLYSNECANPSSTSTRFTSKPSR